MNALEAVQAAVERLGIGAPDRRIVVAVSGGADSTCLLDCLHSLGLPLTVAHFDHALRPGSWADARHVLRLAARLQLPATVGRAAPGALRAVRGSLENAARDARYRFLADVARAGQSTVLAVGHTQDDQAETVLLHLMRGAGVGGLRGMQPEIPLEAITGRPEDSGVRLIRPLLTVPRAATVEWCRAREYTVRRDPTNADSTIQRNRIRTELLPLMATYNPAIQGALARTADLLAAEADASEAICDAFSPAVLRTLAGGRLGIHAAELRSLPMGLQRLILRRALTRLAADGAEIGFEAVERARRAVDRGSRISLPGGIEVHPQGDLRVFGALGTADTDLCSCPQVDGEEPLQLRAPGRVALADGWSVEASVERVSASTRTSLSDPAWQVLLDADACGDAFELGTTRPGERMTPFGASGSKKICDLLQQARVPVPARSRWPVIRQAGAVVWLVGTRRGEGARLDPNSRMQLRLQLIPPGALQGTRESH